MNHGNRHRKSLRSYGKYDSANVTLVQLNDEAKDLAEFLFKNPDYKVLFDASRKVKPKDIEFVKNMIDRMNGGN